MEEISPLECGGNLVKTRKRNGYCVPMTITGSRRRVSLYTRSIVEITARFPRVVERLRDSAIPTDTLSFGELFFVDPRTDIDRYDVFSCFAKSSPERAIALQQELGAAQYMMFSPIVLAGRDITKVALRSRLDIMAEWSDKRKGAPEISFLTPLAGTFKELRAFVVENGWEGLVLYDANGTLSYRLDGDTDRPPRMEGAWKWKPKWEGDFIVRRFGWGSGRNADRMGKLYLSQIDPVTGEEVSCGEVANGFSYDKRFEFARATYPLVVEVEYETRTPNGALTGALYLRTRDDKGMGGCFLPKQLHGLSEKKKKK